MLSSRSIWRVANMQLACVSVVHSNRVGIEVREGEFESGLGN